MQRGWCHLLAACPIPAPRWREKDSNPRSPARETTLRDCLLIEEVRFALDSPLEGAGFEPSVPLAASGRRGGRRGSATLPATRAPPPKVRFATDSSLEREGFE